MPALICVARIGAAHGVRGAVKLWTFTEDPFAVQHYGPLSTKDGKRQLEVALALATRPKLLLLDEPMAGLGPEESLRMIELIDRLRSSVTIVLVEHDMDTVFRLAGRVSVLVSGRLLASGTPDQIRADDDVRRAYLGPEAG